MAWYEYRGTTNDKSITTNATATADDILEGKTGWVNNEKISGNIKSLEATSYTPSTEDIIISSGVYLSGSQIINGNSNLISENIKKDITIFDTTGSIDCVEYPDAMTLISSHNFASTYQIIKSKHYNSNNYTLHISSGNKIIICNSNTDSSTGGLMFTFADYTSTLADAELSHDTKYLYAVFGSKLYKLSFDSDFDQIYVIDLAFTTGGIDMCISDNDEYLYIVDYGSISDHISMIETATGNYKNRYEGIDNAMPYSLYSDPLSSSDTADIIYAGIGDMESVGGVARIAGYNGYDSLDAGDIIWYNNTQALIIGAVIDITLDCEGQHLYGITYNNYLVAYDLNTGNMIYYKKYDKTLYSISYNCGVLCVGYDKQSYDTYILKSDIYLSSYDINGYYTVEYANNMWQAGRGDGYIIYSYDGRSWWYRYNDVNKGSVGIGKINDIKFNNNNIWTACGNSGIAYSTDGENWTKITNVSSDKSYDKVIYGNKTWVVFGRASNIVYYSTDGKTWTASGVNGSSRIDNIYYGGAMWIAYSDDVVYYSIDAKVWSQSNLTGNVWAENILYANNLFVLCTDYGPYYSTDGKTWIMSNLASSSQSNSHAVWGVYYRSGLWVVGSNQQEGLYYSTDGKTWTQSNITSGSYYDILYANNIWVAVSSRGSAILYSTDGKTWVQSDTAGSYNKLVYLDRWYAYSQYNTNSGLITSKDGKTWNKMKMPTGKIYDIAYSDGILISVDASGRYTHIDNELVQTTTTTLSNGTPQVSRNYAYGNAITNDGQVLLCPNTYMMYFYSHSIGSLYYQNQIERHNVIGSECFVDNGTTKTKYYLK